MTSSLFITRILIPLRKPFLNSCFSGVGNSENITIPESEWLHEGLLEAFLRAGFASKGETKYVFGPCPTGTFLNASVGDFYKLQCLECPAGKFRDWFILCDTHNLYFQMR